MFASSEDAGELRVGILDVAHGGVDLGTDVRALREMEEVGEARLAGR